MATHPKTYLTPEQYLEIERKAEFKSEYYQGEMFAMSGAREGHEVGRPSDLEEADHARAGQGHGAGRAFEGSLRAGGREARPRCRGQALATLRRRRYPHHGAPPVPAGEDPERAVCHRRSTGLVDGVVGQTNEAHGLGGLAAAGASRPWAVRATASRKRAFAAFWTQVCRRPRKTMAAADRRLAERVS